MKKIYLVVSAVALIGGFAVAAWHFGSGNKASTETAQSETKGSVHDGKSKDGNDGPLFELPPSDLPIIPTQELPPTTNGFQLPPGAGSGVQPASFQEPAQNAQPYTPIFVVPPVKQ